jgi:hypothetical protein
MSGGARVRGVSDEVGDWFVSGKGDAVWRWPVIQAQFLASALRCPELETIKIFVSPCQTTT